jgi:hypothetical protein
MEIEYAQDPQFAKDVNQPSNKISLKILTVNQYQTQRGGLTIE